jgi:hypothetical protein
MNECCMFEREREHERDCLSVSLELWAEPMHNANYIRNRRPEAGIDPWELLSREVPDLAHLRVFGAR